ncbi:hypothetical protein [Streptomyces diastatochromogenes]|nr:hypothetical protein [Streptomyces diastatochromogenes]MCZ0990157.1 hypothetical protein [Streptomyces diastatochromogenes]
MRSDPAFIPIKRDADLAGCVRVLLMPARPVKATDATDEADATDVTGEA